MTLEIPRELEMRLRPLADEQGETLEAFALTQLEKLARGRGAENSEIAPAETREERRARINRAIDEAQAAFAPVSRVFGDPVAALVAEKRADQERAQRRGL